VLYHVVLDLAVLDLMAPPPCTVRLYRRATLRRVLSRAARCRRAVSPHWAAT